MGSQTTTWALPFPVGTDRVMDGDNAMQALAERVDLLLGGTGAPGGGGTPNPAAPGLWQVASGMTICTDASLAATAGSSISKAMWMKIGKTVWYYGAGNSGTGTTSNAISLPNAVAGTPTYRNQCCGVAGIAGASSPADQSGRGFMGAGLDRLIIVAWNQGYRPAPASHTFFWSVVYDVV